MVLDTDSAHNLFFAMADIKIAACTMEIKIEQ